MVVERWALKEPVEEHGLVVRVAGDGDEEWIRTRFLEVVRVLEDGEGGVSNAPQMLKHFEQHREEDGCLTCQGYADELRALLPAEPPKPPTNEEWVTAARQHSHRPQDKGLPCPLCPLIARADAARKGGA